MTIYHGFNSIYPASFFHEHAGYSYDPKTETPEQGRQRCAEEMARVSFEAFGRHWTAEWDIDPDITSRDWDDEAPERSTWVCYVYDERRDLVGSLGGVDFGEDGTPAEPYGVVVETEIASEALRSRDYATRWECPCGSRGRWTEDLSVYDRAERHAAACRLCVSDIAYPAIVCRDGRIVAAAVTPVGESA